MIPNAWHFHSIVWLCVYGGLVKFSCSVAHTLMQRYVFFGIKMEIFEIQLGNSIGPVKLGMTETEVRNVIGAPDCIYGHRHHFLDGLMVDFDNEGKVEFIEAAASELFSTTLLGFDVHRTLATNVLERIQLEGNYDHSDPELGYSYVF